MKKKQQKKTAQTNEKYFYEYWFLKAINPNQVFSVCILLRTGCMVLLYV